MKGQPLTAKVVFDILCRESAMRLETLAISKKGGRVNSRHETRVRDVGFSLCEMFAVPAEELMPLLNVTPLLARRVRPRILKLLEGNATYRNLHGRTARAIKDHILGKTTA